MEKQKLVYLKEFCQRTKVTLKDFVSYLKKDEERIRHCYEEKSELCSNEYIKMILFDAVFIIEHFIRCYEYTTNDYLANKPLVLTGIHQDLLLFENQLPYFVLDALYTLAFPGPVAFRKLTCLYLNYFIPKDDIRIPYATNILHFTDFLRYVMFSRHPEPNKSSSVKNLPSAAKLHGAGVKFKGVKNACLTDVGFENRKLIMPQFNVDDETELVIRNLMALEQCHYPFEAYICNYIFLMDFLINTAEDVDVLVNSGVIVNWLSSNGAVKKLVKKLCKNTSVCNFCYLDICNSLNGYYNELPQRTKAAFSITTLRTVYFANIWRGTSTVAAVIIVVLTFLQTINSFLQLP